MRVCTQKLDRKGGDSPVSGCTKLNYRVILFFVSNYGKQVWNLQKVISLRTIKDCRFEIRDGVKCVYCIKQAYKFLLKEEVWFSAVL